VSKLTWQTYIYAAGGLFMCVESYDSIFERVRDTHIRMSEEEGVDALQMHWLPPIELTVAAKPEGEGDPPVPARMFISPQAITGVMEIPAASREEVVELEPRR
jgi:hypothetical protein